jgi:hypothetical protein
VGTRVSHRNWRPYPALQYLEEMPGVWTRIKCAFVAFFSILFKGRIPAALILQDAPTVRTSPPSPSSGPSVAAHDRSERAIQMLALFQRDGRLIDFLMEDLGSYSDAEIGAAARDVHAGCRRVLERYVTLAAILSGREQDHISVAEGFDQSAVRLVGNVTGRPPFQGTLLHRGWRAERVDLPPLSNEAGRSVVAPAEIEVA